jgi:hypothetical protein
MGEPTRRDLGRLYAICEDADAELGSLAAELDSGQLRSLVTDALGKLSAIQWYAVKRLGGLPESAGEYKDTDAPGDEIDWTALWEMASPGAADLPRGRVQAE